MDHSLNHPVKRRKLSHSSSNDEPAYQAPFNNVPRPRRPEDDQLFAALAQITLPDWVYTGVMLSLIFGGCCSNVYALEAIIKDLPASGTSPLLQSSVRTTNTTGPLITFTQFALTALLTLPSHIDATRGPLNLYLAPRRIPLTTWLTYTFLFLVVNVLNNAAFNHDISVPVHIILRSGGSITTMLVGWAVAGKKYTRTQFSGVLLLTIGVILAALSDAHSQGKIQPLSTSNQVRHDSWSSTHSFAIGLSLLLVAQLLSAYMGLYIQQIYSAIPGSSKPWRENLLYSHALSLPFFLPFHAAITSQFTALLSSPPIATYLPDPLPLPPSDLNTLALGLEYLTKTPVKILQLALNAITQYACIRGVNVLSARSSALTVTIVLNVRKLVSLLLSIWLFGNTLAPGVLVGAVIVFIGGGVYGWQPGKKKEKTYKDGKAEGLEALGAKDGKGLAEPVSSNGRLEMERKKEL